MGKKKKPIKKPKGPETLDDTVNPDPPPPKPPKT